MECLCALGTVHVERLIRVILVSPDPVFEDEGDIVGIMIIMVDVSEEKIMGC
jgi:hypothetical protein